MTMNLQYKSSYSMTTKILKLYNNVDGGQTYRQTAPTGEKMDIQMDVQNT